MSIFLKAFFGHIIGGVSIIFSTAGHGPGYHHLGAAHQQPHKTDQSNSGCSLFNYTHFCLCLSFLFRLFTVPESTTTGNAGGLDFTAKGGKRQGREVPGLENPKPLQVGLGFNISRISSFSMSSSRHLYFAKPMQP
jgi:hypothetical protein